MSATLVRFGGLVGGAAPRLVVGALARAVAELSALGLMATAAWLIARAAQRPPIEALSLAIVSVRAFALSRGVFRYLERLISHDAALGALARLRPRMFSSLVPQAPGGARTPRGGESLNRMVSDAEAIQDLVVRCAVPYLVGAIVSAVAVGLSAAILPVAGLILAAGLLVCGGLVPVVAAARSRRAARAMAPVRDRLAVRQLDLLHGGADLEAFGAADGALEAADRTAAELEDLERRAARIAAWSAGAGFVLQGVTAAAVTAVALRAGAAGTIDSVLVAVLALVALTSFEAVAPLPAAAQRLVEIGGSAKRVLAVLDLPVPARAEPADPPDGPPVVRMRDVRVRYEGRTAPALDGVSLCLSPGRRTVLVGASGSGKSTLLAVLLRFVEPEAGEVTLGGTELRRFEDAELRRRISAVTQDAHVFHVTLRENLLLARPEATTAELRAACAAAGLLEWIDSLPDGLETMAGEDGARMSGGQRRRLTLARALLADPPVLLLDEPTEGLDPEAADALMDDVLAATEGRTTLLVTHRLDGLAAADEVLVLEAGRIVQQGAPAELASAPGRYRELNEAWPVRS
ncbi:thiol reductant ABC exporter subunit CydC [Spirillospora sp. CA-294931]|uniref:thiol reductant ABC exporter subunit CydC n=1 Tax=Spirillospora sp. CA-294931 TaxID=3240042 RepID=UPI003D89EDC6